MHIKKNIKELKEAIDNETYDEFMETVGKDEWEIIEDLLEELVKKDIRIKELEGKLGDKHIVITEIGKKNLGLQAKVDELEEYKRLHDGESQAHFECVCENATLQDRHQSLMKALDEAMSFRKHIQSHLKEGEKVICKICGKSADDIEQDFIKSKLTGGK